MDHVKMIVSHRSSSTKENFILQLFQQAQKILAPLCFGLITRISLESWLPFWAVVILKGLYSGVGMVAHAKVRAAAVASPTTSLNLSLISSVAITPMAMAMAQTQLKKAPPVNSNYTNANGVSVNGVAVRVVSKQNDQMKPNGRPNYNGKQQGR